jgi:hypothetical protein
VIVNSRWGYGCAAALIVLVLVTIAGAFAVRPIEAGQDSTLEELERGEPDATVGIDPFAKAGAEA